MPYTIYIWATHSSTHNIFAFVLKRLGYRVTFIDQHWSGPEPGLDNVQVIIFDPAVEPEQARAWLTKCTLGYTYPVFFYDSMLGNEPQFVHEAAVWLPLPLDVLQLKQFIETARAGIDQAG